MASRGSIAREAWIEARAKWESGMTMNAIAAELGVKSQTVHDRKNREGWERAGKADEAAKLTLRKLADASTISEALDKETDRRADLIRTHRAQWADISVRRESLLLAHDQAMQAMLSAIQEGDKERFRTERDYASATTIGLKQLRDAVEMLDKSQQGERRAWGLDFTAIEQEQELAAKREAQEMLAQLMTDLDRIEQDKREAVRLRAEAKGITLQ